MRFARIALAAIALVVAGCGGDNEDGATGPRVSPETTTEAQPPPDTTLPPKPSPELVQALRRDAGTWASLFADKGCNENKYMAEPMCERIGSVSAAFQKSFASARVEGIEHRGVEEVGPPAGSIHVAAVTFSNGVVVVFGGGGQRWYPRTSRAREMDRGACGRSKGRIRTASSWKPQRSKALTSRSLREGA